MAEFRVLTSLVVAGRSLPLGELAAAGRCARSHVTQVVDRLEPEGLVRRKGGPATRRSVQAELTSPGSERQAAGGRSIARAQSEVMAALPAAWRTELARASAALG